MAATGEIIRHGEAEDAGAVVGQPPAPGGVMSSKDIAAYRPRLDQQAIAEAKEMLTFRDDVMRDVMRKDLDYGVIPGTGAKPALLKPGAERLLGLYRLTAQLTDEVAPVEDMTGEQHGGEPFIQYRRRCVVTPLFWPEGMEKPSWQASGSCNSWEKKYRYRDARRVCPSCDQPFIFKSKPPKTGYYCWSKPEKGMHGCGENFPGDSQGFFAIDAQDVGQVANPDVAEQLNTILKMADKRALVAATIIATGWSDIVTQDIEDGVPGPASHAGTPAEEMPPVRASSGGEGASASVHPGRTPSRPSAGAVLCEECKRLGLKSKNGYPPKVWAGKAACDGVEPLDGEAANHPRPGLAPDEQTIDDPTPVPF